MTPILVGLVGLKMVLSHLLLKKMAIATLISFLLSKVSFILASLVALKQFFHTPQSHRSNDSNKLEVVHIPIRNHRHTKENDNYYDESKFIPITFKPDSDAFGTTEFDFDFPYSGSNPDTETFSSSNEEGLNGGGSLTAESFNEGNINDDEKLNDIYNEHFDDGQNAMDRSDVYRQKTYYKNHVHSPF